MGRRRTGTTRPFALPVETGDRRQATGNGNAGQTAADDSITPRYHQHGRASSNHTNSTGSPHPEASNLTLKAAQQWSLRIRWCVGDSAPGPAGAAYRSARSIYPLLTD